jgi:hypothetical protein
MIGSYLLITDAFLLVPLPFAAEGNAVFLAANVLPAGLAS